MHFNDHGGNSAQATYPNHLKSTMTAYTAPITQ
jgi:hypothetical protein